jgi:hypothetical protein
VVLVLLNISLECRFGATKKKGGKKFFFSLSFWFGFGSLSTFRFFLYLRELLCDKLKKKREKKFGEEKWSKNQSKNHPKKKKKKKLERLCVCWRATAARARETERQRETERDTERDGE